MVLGKLCFVSIIFFVLMELSACGPQYKAEYESSSQNIINGQLVAQGEHMETVIVDNQKEYMLCSGTLIAPRVVLTAAHCVVDTSGEELDPQNYIIDFGNVWDTNDNVEVIEVRVHPEYVRIVSGDHSSSKANDLALLRLADAAPANVQPVPALPKSLMITSDDVGVSLEFVGFGVDEIGDRGVKRKIHKEIAKVCTSSSGCLWNVSYWAAPNSICIINQPGGVCSGDSGGPAFITLENQVYVAGVTSYGGDSECKTFGCSTKVDHFEDFIQEFLPADNGIGCSYNSECHSGHCVQGVCCDTSCSNDNLCDGEETCPNGFCTGGQQLDCDDGDSCTADVCDQVSGCENIPIPNCYAPCKECQECQKCLDGICVDTDKCSDDNGGCNQAGNSPNILAGLLLGLIVWFRRELFA